MEEYDNYIENLDGKTEKESKAQFNTHKDLEDHMDKIDLTHMLKDKVLRMKDCPLDNFDFETLHINSEIIKKYMIKDAEATL